MGRFFLLVALFLTAGILSPVATAQNNVVRHNYKEHPQTHIHVDGVVTSGQQGGNVPYRVTIRNNSGEDKEWRVRFSESSSWRGLGYTSDFSFPVENGNEITAEVNVPIPPSFVANSSYRGMTISAFAPGLTMVTRNDNEQADPAWPTILLSKKLAQRSLSKLTDARKKSTKSSHSSSRFRFGYSYEPSMLASDWLGYTAFDVLMIDKSEWNSLKPSQKQAIFEWIRMGGRMDIYAKEKFPLTDLGFNNVEYNGSKTELRASLGKIVVQTWDGKELSTNMVNRYRSVKKVQDAVQNDFDNSWNLLDRFGQKSFSPALVFVLLIIFAVIVAPVNLFYFAKEGQRHRLFITTPLISLAACLIIMAIIYIKDGVGGNGLRVALADLQSHTDEKRVYIHQQQISRTGVMLSSGFEAEEQMEITPVKLPKSPWNPLSRSGSSLGSLRFAGKKMSGDFFRSRSEQGFAIRASRPTRARIEVRKPAVLSQDVFDATQDTPPELFSSLAFSVEEFFYRDDFGRVWRTPDGATVDPGNPIPLEMAETDTLVKWIKEASEPFGKAKGDSIRALNRKKNRFFAVVKQPEQLLVETSPSIRWNNDFVLLTGSLPTTASRPEPKEEQQ